MDPATLLLTALGLSMDCFAVAVGGSLLMPSLARPQVLRAACCFGIFQAGMAGLGWLGGRTIVGVIEDFDHWIAFALLFLVGSRMIYESYQSHDGSSRRVDVTSGATLIVLSVATSIDALAVGVSLGFLGSGIFRASLVIGMVAFLVTGIGFSLGRRVGAATGRWAGIAGGLVLVGIGVRILITHLT